MNFSGLSGSAVFFVFALSGLLASAFYLLKLRRNRVAVPFIPLWERVLENKESTTLWSSLKRIISLLLQLLLLGLLALALGDPKMSSSLDFGHTKVVLIDVSASMQSNDVVGYENRFEAAKKEVKNLISSLGMTDKMILVSMGDQPYALGPMTNERSELFLALDKLRSEDGRAHFPKALDYAMNVLRDQPRPQLFLVSDGGLSFENEGPNKLKLQLASIPFYFLPIGEASSDGNARKPSRNLAITEFSVRRYPLDRNRYEVMLEVANTGIRDEEAELSLFGDGSLVDVSRLHVDAGKIFFRFYSNLSGANHTLEAEISPVESSVDLLRIDNRAYAVLPEQRLTKVRVVTSGNTYLEAALLLEEYIEAEIVNPSQYEKLNKSERQKVDVTIFDDVTPAAFSMDTDSIFIHPVGEGSPVKVAGTLTSPGFDKVEKKHPLMAFVDLEDVNILQAEKLKPEKEDKVVGASTDGALLVEGNRLGKRFIALGFDIRQSDLPLRISWPVLLMNCIHFFSEKNGDHFSSFNVGEVWKIPVASAAKTASLTLPNKEIWPIPIYDSHAVFRGQKLGFYELNLQTDDPQIIEKPYLFAANLNDAQESEIGVKTNMEIDGIKLSHFEKAALVSPQSPWMVLLVAAIVLVTIEWISYHKRITV